MCALTVNASKIALLHTGISCLTWVQLYLPVVYLSRYLDSALGPQSGIGMTAYGEK